MKKNWEVVDEAGRIWVKTLTAIKAARYVQLLRETRGLVCVVREVRP